MNRILPLLIVFACVTLRAQQLEYWFNPVGTANTGALGKAADPYVTPDEASFDAIINGPNIGPNSTIHLMAGTFITTNISLQTGQRIQGAGMM